MQSLAACVEPHRSVASFQAHLKGEEKLKGGAGAEGAEPHSHAGP